MAGLSDARARIIKRLEAIEAEAAVLRKQLDLLDQALALEELRPASEPTRKRPANPPRERIVAIVIDAALKAGRPISRQEAMEAVTDAGLTIEGARPVEVLATMLWRERETVAKSDAGYWPADKPLP
ncbi:MAG TPA: hypothetical protein VGV07_18025 [Devosia sp.]|uniref:hypothetical protein n=1 Tax=Devosia sp. TaxID=1871048 RepID=UPI002DDCCDBA|nr:hypothetical protein [Devosia sp.]HEV2517157.1 hypothetical protein [Devosia sp.]